VGLASPSPPLCLLDHVVGPHQQRGRNFEAERLGGLEVDDELEFGRLLDRQVGRRGSGEHLGKLARPLPKDFGKARAIADQPALFRE
jgi:hypothetical protein